MDRIKKLLIILLVLIIISIVVYVIFYEKKPDVVLNEHFSSNEISKFIKNKGTYQLSELNDYIITNNVKKIEYTYFNEEKSIIGNIYINENDECVYIDDSNNNNSIKISNIKFKTMYVKNYEFNNNIFVFLIANDGSAYNIMLYGNDISESRLYKYPLDYKFTNFVNLEFNHDMYDLPMPVFAKTSDNAIIDINSGLEYSEDIIGLYGAYYVYKDKTITSAYGKSIEDKDGNKYKIKYIFDIIKDDNNELDNGVYVIITEDNEFIYTKVEQTHVYEFDKKVKEVSFDVNYPYIDGNLDIIFEDDYKMNFTARCNEYFCPNEFAE